MKKIIEYTDDRELLDKLRGIIKDKSTKMGGPENAYNLFKKHAGDDVEHFMIAVLNGAHEVVDVLVVTKGLVNRTIVHPREIFRPALMLNACAIILSHNHPSGNLEPSPEDLEITQRLVDAGGILGVPVLDHVIISKNGYRSLVETGEMRMPTK